ncbi:ras-related protein Rab-35-like [Armigeres subalbatus]|uniref:ras-related protein Rab-35-like n=1 Tax=Armigeres subalbatus TaxID=124917 RepID=UPI002ED05B60
MLLKTDGNVPNVYKLLIIGDSGVGKSSLLLRYADNIFPQQHQITIGVDFKIRTLTIHGERVKLQIWDTAGQERFRLITNSYYRGAHGVVIMYDVTNMRSFQHVKRWLREVEVNCRTTGEVYKLLVGNKNDNPQLKAVPPRDAKAFADLHGMEFIESSARECFNVDKVFKTIAKQLVRRQLKEDGQDWCFLEKESIMLSDPRVDSIKNQGFCC